MKIEIINNVEDLNRLVPYFNEYKCIVIICKYNGGKSSTITEIIHKHFGEEKTYYVTLIDQSKLNFTPRQSRLEFGKIVRNKIVVFDEISDEKNREVRQYIRELIKENRVIILTNPYGSSNDVNKEVNLFKSMEREILPVETMFIFFKLA